MDVTDTLKDHDQKTKELIDLLARCSLRDHAALKQLYDRVSGYLNGVAYKLLKSDDLANDALQDAFIQIWENAANYRPQMASPLTWMTSIVRYRALDRLDKETRYERTLKANDSDDADLSWADERLNPDASFSDSQQRHHIFACLEGLNDSMSTSIALAYLEGYSRDEIAERLNTNTNTVKSWLHRGAERLKSCLETKMAVTQ